MTKITAENLTPEEQAILDGMEIEAQKASAMPGVSNLVTPEQKARWARKTQELIGDT